MPEGVAGSKHIARLTPKKTHVPGCVTKHEGDYKKDNCSYRWNGYNEMKGSHKSLYELDFTRSPDYDRLPWIYKEFKLGSAGGKKKKANWRFADDPSETKTAWWFVKTNFQIAYLPYNHNYHHILPFEAIKQLSYPELEILQASKYNLNGPKNMIILPCLDAYGVAMKLPAHPYNHPAYNSEVKGVIEEIKQEIGEKKDKHAVTADNVTDFKDYIESWQERQFEMLVEYGEALAAVFIDPEKGGDPNQVNYCPMATALGG